MAPSRGAGAPPPSPRSAHSLTRRRNRGPSATRTERFWAMSPPPAPFPWLLPARREPLPAWPQSPAPRGGEGGGLRQEPGNPTPAPLSPAPEKGRAQGVSGLQVRGPGHPPEAAAAEISRQVCSPESELRGHVENEATGETVTHAEFPLVLPVPPRKSVLVSVGFCHLTKTDWAFLQTPAAGTAPRALAAHCPGSFRPR
uniref:Uncharacterized protein n=2 Tax=Myotis myotis TaxID=51298 RepID=A0A7J7QT33_MYOMY|nr:hypothetical protein mMyoMyo1_011846 [Myotis myotis]